MHFMLAEDIGPAILEMMYFGVGFIFVVAALIGFWPAAHGHRITGLLCTIPAFGWGTFQTIRMFLFWSKDEYGTNLGDLLMPWLIQAAPSLLVSSTIMVVIYLGAKKRI